MEHLNEIRIPKLTGTYADVLRTAGVASILEELTGRHGSVSISDLGHEYLIASDLPIPSDPNQIHLTVGYPYLAHEGKKAKAPPKGISPTPFPYAEERRKEEIWDKHQEANREQKRTRRRSKTGEDLAAVPPRPDRRLNLMKGVNSLRAGSESWNDLACWIHERLSKDKDEFIGATLQLLNGIKNNRLKNTPSITMLQAFLPTAGKGINRSKPDGAKLENLDGDWFVEWCKYRGVWYALNANFVGKDGKDLKFVALLPGLQIHLAVFANLADDFVEGNWLRMGRAFTNIKSDIYCILGLARWLIEHSEFAPVPQNRLFKFLKSHGSEEARPRDLVAGISTAYFKSLGTGRALANTNSLFLPDWFPLSSKTYQNWLALLDEHQQVLQWLDEEKTEEAELLAKYRNAISANDLSVFLDFFSGFGANLMRRLDRKMFTEQFTKRRLEVLIMGLSQHIIPNVGLIVKDQAFLSIADAVHEATVKAQYWKGQNRQEYDVHYGLAQKWKRAADRGMEFIHMLADFVRQYNEENAKRKEKGRGSRDDVLRTDLDRVLEYVTSGKIETRTLCLLLLAYGYAMTDKERESMEAARDKKKANQNLIAPQSVQTV